MPCVYWVVLAASLAVLLTAAVRGRGDAVSVFAVYSWDYDPAEDQCMHRICATFAKAIDVIQPDPEKWTKHEKHNQWSYDDDESNCRWIIKEWAVLGS